MGRRQENRDKFEADVATLQTLCGMFAKAFDNLSDFEALIGADEQLSNEEYMRRYNGALAEGQEVEACMDGYIKALATPRSNNKLFFKHRNFYSSVPRCLHRLKGALNVYRTGFRLLVDGNDDYRMSLVEKAWGVVDDSMFVESNLLFLRDLPVAGVGYVEEVVTMEKTLDRQMEGVVALSYELTAALGMKEG